MMGIDLSKPLQVRNVNSPCQEQIEMSGFVANELSAFTVHQEGFLFEQEVSGGCSLSSAMILVQELSTAILPQPLRSVAGNGCG